jgi:hypothetical protein
LSCSFLMKYFLKNVRLYTIVGQKINVFKSIKFRVFVVKQTTKQEIIIFKCFSFTKGSCGLVGSLIQMHYMGKGHYYKFHNIKNQKEHRKICKSSLHRKSLFSWSLLRHFRCSDFTYGVKKDHNIKNQNINYLWHITYGYQGLWGPGGLG